MSSQSPSSLFLIGVGGFGESHLRNIRRLQATNHVKPIALVDPVVKAKIRSDPHFVAPDDAPLFDTFQEALQEVGKPDIVIICVPIHLHAPFTKEALLAGCDILLEKPPFARFDDFQEILELEKKTGCKIQVGFQSLGSLAIDAFESDQFGIGTIKSVRAMGCWLRREWYWKRSPWVGRKHIGNMESMDGVTTNALAHAVITALHVAGIKESDEVKQVEMELYRANPIDVDDTSSLRITPMKGPKVITALTLCASEQTKPIVEVVGEKGIASFGYVDDNVVVNGEIIHFDRIDLLGNLVEHRRNPNQVPLRLPLRSTGGFMRIMEAVRKNKEPIHIERKWIEKRDEGSEAHPVIKDIEKWIRAAADKDGLFSEVGAPWSFTGKDNKLWEEKIDNTIIFEILDGQGTTPSSTPRPYIHPIRTLGGIELTATHPADHDWHCGLGFVVPDVDGTSFWGGGTFIKGKGYVNLDNHGIIKNENMEKVGDTGLNQILVWYNHSGRMVIRESRQLRWSKLGNGWVLSYGSTLTAIDEDVSLGSPGTNGRKDGGYGGFFWRLPRCADATILSAENEGEDNIHGKLSPWIAWSSRFEARPDSTGYATLVFMSEEDSASDPWIVRCKGYPGIGSAVAWEERTKIPAGKSINRSFRVGIYDGKSGREEIELLVKNLKERGCEFDM